MALLTDTSGIRAEPSSKIRYGETLFLGTYQKPAPLDPLRYMDTIAVPLRDLIFSKLLRLTRDGQYEPDLAERFEVTADGLTYTFYLRPDVKFHDGVPLTSEDVVYSFQLMSDKKVSPLLYDSFDKVAKWEAPSPNVVRVILKEPFSTFLRYLWRAYIIPKHALPFPEKDMDSFAVHPIGTGPFVFADRRDTGEILLKANENYFGGRPYLDSVAVKIFPTRAQVWSAFLRGEIDMMTDLTRSDYEEIQSNPGFSVFRSLPLWGYVLMFNVQDPLLSKPKMREAIRSAIRPEEILGRFENGEGELIDGPFHPQSWVYDPKRPLPAARSEIKIESLLQAEGYQKKNGMFQRQAVPLSLGVMMDRRDGHLVDIAKMIRQQLSEAGIQTRFEYFSDYEELSKLAKLKDSKFQSYLFRVKMGTDPDIASQYWEGKGNYNWGGYASKNVDQLFATARAIQNQNERAADYLKIEEIMRSDRPAVFLYIPHAFHAVTRRVQGAETLSWPHISFFHFKDVYKMNQKRGGD